MIEITGTVRVGVATCRPPREDAVIWIQAIGRGETIGSAETDLVCVAVQIVYTHPHVVMPVAAEIISIEV